MASKGEARRDRIYQEVLYKEVVRVGELAQELGVSTETIRRDLDLMEHRGLVERDHGIARIRADRSRGLMSVREGLNTESKGRIAEAAARYLEGNEVVFCDGGTTGLALAKLMARQRGLTVVTNGLAQAQELAPSGNEVIMLGGRVDKRDEGSLGGFACEMVDHILFDVVFLGTDGLRGAKGPTSYFVEDMDLKRHLLAGAGRVVLMADSSKFDYKGSFQFCPWRDVDVLVTNGLTAESRALVADAGEIVSV